MAQVRSAVRQEDKSEEEAIAPRPNERLGISTTPESFRTVSTMGGLSLPATLEEPVAASLNTLEDPARHLYPTLLYENPTNAPALLPNPAQINFNPKRNKCTLKLTNTQNTPIKFNILPPKKKMFSLHMHAPENNTRDDSPKNRLAPPQLVATLMPGMTHKIEVHFTPPLDPGAVGTAAKFQDQILVHTQTHNFCVPIRACPTEAKLQLPARIDFSHVARGAEIQREFTISPDSSQPFEFEFKIIQYSALPGELQLTPMHGKVSANESVRVQVTYAPKRYATARISMILQSPQLGLDSRHIEIIGSSAPRSIANARSSSPISEGTIADGTRVVAVMPACDEKSQPDQINVCIVPEAESESLAYASTANQATRRNSSTLRDALDDNIDDVKATLEDLDVDRSGFVTLPQFGEMAKLVLGVGSGQEVTSWNSHRAVVELFDELGGQTGRLQYADIQTKQSCMAAFSQDSIAPVQLPLASLDDDVAHKMVINKTPAIPMINDDECDQDMSWCKNCVS